MKSIKQMILESLKESEVAANATGPAVANFDPLLKLNNDAGGYIMKRQRKTWKDQLRGLHKTIQSSILATRRLTR